MNDAFKQLKIIQIKEKPQILHWEELKKTKNPQWEKERSLWKKMLNPFKMLRW